MVDHGDDRDAPDGGGQAGESASGGGERVAKALARAGVASRRDVERYIAAGRVALNGRTLDTPAVKVGRGDILTVDGAVVGGPEATRVWRYSKPAGLLTSHGDPAGRPTVFEHMPADLPRVISVGRLDLPTEGLLLLTNDGELARRLELPDNGWRRVYRARAHGRADQGRLDTLREGVTIDGVRYGPVEARLDKATGRGAVGRGRVSDAPANLWITVTVAEGKNREVRRVLEHLGLTVNRLIRLAYGPFALGELQPGEVEEISPRVLREQLVELIAPESLPQGNRRPGPPTRGAPFVPPAASVRAAPVRHLRDGRAAPTDGAKSKGAGAAARKGGHRPTGAAGRVSEAWTPPAERKGRGPGAAKPAFGRGAKAGSPTRADRTPSRFGEGPSRGEPPSRSGGEPHGRAASRPRPGEGATTAKSGRPPRADAAPSRPKAPARPAAGPPRGGRAAVSPFAEAKSTGLELAPTMRRGPRRKPGDKGPRRPPRGG